MRILSKEDGGEGDHGPFTKAQTRRWLWGERVVRYLISKYSRPSHPN